MKREVIMETTRSLPRTRKVPLRNGQITRETLNFRRVARQVMLANMFTRKTTNGHYVKSSSSSKSAAALQNQVPHRLVTKRERKHSSNMAELPPMKRRGTPELFPMSEEMKQTVISLGKLDLLPGEVRKVRGDSVFEDSRVESRASYTFREKTRKRIIQPQRFIRNVRTSLILSKRIPENTEENCEEEVGKIAKDDENRTSKDTTDDKANYSNSTEENNAALITRKSNCNILSRPQTTNFAHLTAKSPKNQYTLYNNRPIYATRFSDLGPLTTRRPVRIPSQSIWPKIAFDSTRMQTRENYFPKKARRNTVTGKAWVANEDNSGENHKSNDEALKTRRWKSVESLTREIEIKCLSWLENRYGSGMI